HLRIRDDRDADRLRGGTPDRRGGERRERDDPRHEDTDENLHTPTRAPLPCFMHGDASSCAEYGRALSRPSAVGSPAARTEWPAMLLGRCATVRWSGR